MCHCCGLKRHSEYFAVVVNQAEAILKCFLYYDLDNNKRSNLFKLLDCKVNNIPVTYCNTTDLKYSYYIKSPLHFVSALFIWKTEHSFDEVIMCDAKTNRIWNDSNLIFPSGATATVKTIQSCKISLGCICYALWMHEWSIFTMLYCFFLLNKWSENFSCYCEYSLRELNTVFVLIIRNSSYASYCRLSVCCVLAAGFTFLLRHFPAALWLLSQWCDGDLPAGRLNVTLRWWCQAEGWNNVEWAWWARLTFPLSVPTAGILLYKRLQKRNLLF